MDSVSLENAKPLIAKLLASLPEPVKIISSGLQESVRAIAYLD